jgi:UDP-glucose 4-epimerase
VTILQLADRALAATNSSSERVFVPYEQVYGHGIDEMFQRMPAIEKITAVVGWTPTIDLDRILAEVVEHARQGVWAKA